MKVGSTALSLAVMMTLLCQTSHAARHTIGLDSNSTSKGESTFVNNSARAPLRLEPQLTGAFVVSFENGIPAPLSICTLLSIDHKLIRNFSRENIEELLRGPAGSTIEIEYMLPDGRVKTISLTRRPVKHVTVGDCKALGNSCYFYDDRNSSDWSGAYVQDSRDIEARASQNLVQRGAIECYSASVNAIGTAALAAALTEYEVGKFDSGDADLETCFRTYREGHPWGLSQNREPGKSIRTLLSVHKEDDAKRLVQISEEPGNNNVSLEVAYEAIALSQLRTTGPAAAVASLEQFEREEKERSGYVNPIPDMGEIYERAGAYTKSAEVYAGVIKSRSSRNVQWSGITELARYKMHLAYAQDKLGDSDYALATIQEAIAAINTLPKEQVANLERMPGIFPRLSDLEDASNRLDSGIDFDVKNDVGSTRDVFPDIRECHSAIKSHDKAKAVRLLDSFLAQYRGHVPSAFESAGRQNLYSSILTMAREMSDAGWINESDAVLHRLGDAADGKDANDLARAYLQAEIAFNASKKKSDASTEWNELESLLHVFPNYDQAADGHENDGDTRQPEVKKSVKDIAFGTRLRILALMYYYANELERAQTFLNQALLTNEVERGQPSKLFVHGNEDSGTQRILMLLDGACLAAKTQHFEKAELLWKQLQTLEIVRGDAYPNTVIELCSLYVDNNRADKAIEILEQLRGRSSGFRSHQSDNGYTNVDFMLAKLLRATGKTREAKTIADEAAAEMPGRLPWSNCLFVAQCSEEEGDFARAAKYYAMYPWASHEFSTERPERYLDKALECALKAPTYDKVELSKLYVSVADVRAGAPQNEDASDLYQKATNLLPDSDPQKSSLMIRRANNNYYQNPRPMQQPEEKKTSADKHSNNGDLTPAGSVPADTTAENERFALIQTHLHGLERAAIFAEQHHHPDVRSDWAQLACAEITNGEWRKGVEHAQHVISLFSGQDLNKHSDVLGDRAQITGCLISTKHSDEAEKLLIAAVARAQSVGGARNIGTQGQLKDLFVFYVAQREYVKAKTILDKILDCDLTTGETLSQSLSHSHCGWPWPQSGNGVEVMEKIFEALDRARKIHPSFVKDSLEKILVAQRKVLAPTDERISPTLAFLGDINFEVQKYDAADGYYSQAFSITKEYHQGELAVREAGKHFIENLKKLGRDEEAQTLSEAEWEGIGKK